jgi:hypothetical protein
MRKHRWIAVWENDTRQFPEETQIDYAKKLLNIERRNGLNWCRETAVLSGLDFIPASTRR